MLILSPHLAILDVLPSDLHVSAVGLLTIWVRALGGVTQGKKALPLLEHDILKFLPVQPVRGQGTGGGGGDGQKAAGRDREL